MKTNQFNGCKKLYPERIDGTAEWFYCKEPSFLDVEDLLKTSDNFIFEGNQLFLMNISGRIFEPIQQKHNVFLSQPIYNIDDNALAIIKYDFSKGSIQIVKYDIQTDYCSVVGEVSLSKGGDLINVRILQNSYVLVKHEPIKDITSILYPFEKKIQLEENEGLFLINDNKLISRKWIEDPDYREEIIVRDFNTTEITERKNGYASIMPNGEIWMLTE